jgi:hypothetical protein
MVTDRLSVAVLGLAVLGLALAWPAPTLVALGLAGPAASGDGDAPGNVAVPLAG